jgi:hydrogenase maturation factor HypF (carbamoyltransferase family)
MKEQSNSICKIINDINSKEEIKTLKLVGGYCSNEILTNLIKAGLNKVTTYLQPSNPILAIMEGAVLFGIQPSIINVRKAKYTIGKATN